MRVKARLKTRTEWSMVSVVRCGCHLRISGKKNSQATAILIAWSLTRFQVRNDGRTAFVRVFWESLHEPSVAIRRKSDILVHGRAERQSGSGMGPENLGWQGANDRRTHHSDGEWSPETKIVRLKREIRDE